MKKTAATTTAKTATKSVAPVTTSKATTVKSAREIVLTAVIDATKNEVAPVETKKIEVAILGKTTYHYFRNFIRPLFKSNLIISAKFVKVEGYNGHISISKAEKVKAAKLIADKVKADGSVDLIWE